MKQPRKQTSNRNLRKGTPASPDAGSSFTNADFTQEYGVLGFSEAELDRAAIRNVPLSLMDFVASKYSEEFYKFADIYRGRHPEMAGASTNEIFADSEARQAVLDQRLDFTNLANVTVDFRNLPKANKITVEKFPVLDASNATPAGRFKVLHSAEEMAGYAKLRNQPPATLGQLVPQLMGITDVKSAGEFLFRANIPGFTAQALALRDKGFDMEEARSVQNETFFQAAPNYKQMNGTYTQNFASYIQGKAFQATKDLLRDQEKQAQFASLDALDTGDVGGFDAEGNDLENNSAADLAGEIFAAGGNEPAAPLPMNVVDAILSQTGSHENLMCVASADYLKNQVESGMIGVAQLSPQERLLLRLHVLYAPKEIAPSSPAGQAVDANGNPFPIEPGSALVTFSGLGEQQSYDMLNQVQSGQIVPVMDANGNTHYIKTAPGVQTPEAGRTIKSDDFLKIAAARMRGEEPSAYDTVINLATGAVSHRDGIEAPYSPNHPLYAPLDYKNNLLHYDEHEGRWMVAPLSTKRDGVFSEPVQIHPIEVDMFRRDIYPDFVQGKLDELQYKFATLFKNAVSEIGKNLSGGGGSPEEPLGNTELMDALYSTAGRVVEDLPVAGRKITVSRGFFQSVFAQEPQPKTSEEMPKHPLYRTSAALVVDYQDHTDFPSEQEYDTEYPMPDEDPFDKAFNPMVGITRGHHAARPGILGGYDFGGTKRVAFGVDFFNQKNTDPLILSRQQYDADQAEERQASLILYGNPITDAADSALGIAQDAAYNAISASSEGVTGTLAINFARYGFVLPKARNGKPQKTVTDFVTRAQQALSEVVYRALVPSSNPSFPDRGGSLPNQENILAHETSVLASRDPNALARARYIGKVGSTSGNEFARRLNDLKKATGITINYIPGAEAQFAVDYENLVRTNPEQAKLVAWLFPRGAWVSEAIHAAYVSLPVQAPERKPANVQHSATAVSTIGTDDDWEIIRNRLDNTTAVSKGTDPNRPFYRGDPKKFLEDMATGASKYQGALTIFDLTDRETTAYKNAMVEVAAKINKKAKFTVQTGLFTVEFFDKNEAPIHQSRSELVGPASQSREIMVQFARKDLGQKLEDRFTRTDAEEGGIVFGVADKDGKVTVLDVINFGSDENATSINLDKVREKGIAYLKLHPELGGLLGSIHTHPEDIAPSYVDTGKNTWTKWGPSMIHVVYNTANKKLSVWTRPAGSLTLLGTGQKSPTGIWVIEAGTSATSNLVKVSEESVAAEIPFGGHLQDVPLGKRAQLRTPMSARRNRGIGDDLTVGDRLYEMGDDVTPAAARAHRADPADVDPFEGMDPGDMGDPDPSEPAAPFTPPAAHGPVLNTSRRDVRRNSFIHSLNQDAQYQAWDRSNPRSRTRAEFQDYLGGLFDLHTAEGTNRGASEIQRELERLPVFSGAPREMLENTSVYLHTVQGQIWEDPAAPTPVPARQSRGDYLLRNIDDVKRNARLEVSMKDYNNALFGAGYVNHSPINGETTFGASYGADNVRVHDENGEEWENRHGGVETITHTQALKGEQIAFRAIDEARAGALPSDPLSKAATLKVRTDASIKSQIDEVGKQLDSSGMDHETATAIKDKYNSVARFVADKVFDQIKGAIGEDANANGEPSLRGGKGVGDIAYNAVKVNRLDTARQIMASHPGLAGRLPEGSSIEELVASKNATVVYDPETRDAYQFGQDGGGGMPGGGGKFGGALGSAFYGAYMLKREWQIAAQPTMDVAKKYGEYASGFAGASTAEALSNGAAGYTARQSIAEQAQGKAAYQEFGAFMDIPYRLSDNGAVNRLGATAGVAAGVAVGGTMAGFTMGFMPALAGAAPVVATAGAVIGGTIAAGGLAMEAYNAVAQPDSPITFSSIARDLDKSSLRAKAFAAIKSANESDPSMQAQANAYADQTVGTATGGTHDLVRAHAIDNFYNNQVYNDRELAQHLSGTDRVAFNYSENDPALAQIETATNAIAGESGEDPNSIKGAVAGVAKLYGRNLTEAEGTAWGRRMKGTGRSTDQLMSEAGQYASALGLMPGTPAFIQASEQYGNATDEPMRQTMMAGATRASGFSSQIAGYVGSSFEASAIQSAYGLDNQGAMDTVTPALRGYSDAMSGNVDPFVQRQIISASQQAGNYQSQVYTSFANQVVAGGGNFAGTFTSLASSGMSNQQATLLDQMASGDMGALSYGAWMGGTSEFRSRDQSGNAIQETSGSMGLDFLRANASKVNLTPTFGIDINAYTNQQVSDKMWGGDQGLSSAFMSGGTRQVQIVNNQRNYDNQMASLGIQGAGIALTQAYNWGSGSYSAPAAGSSWDLENQARALQVSSTRADFTYQGQQMQVSNAYSIQRENQQAQRTATSYAQNVWSMDSSYNQSVQQRGWTRQDYQYQDTTRGLNFQWQMEDANTNIRYASGAERRQLVKQKDRDALMYGIEGEQIDKTRDRQKETWAIEDERYTKEKQYALDLNRLDLQSFQTNKSQREQTFKAEMDNFSRKKNEFEQEKSLQDQQIELQRKYQNDQINLQLAALGVQIKAAAEQKKFNDGMLTTNNAFGDAGGRLKELAQYAGAAAKASDALRVLMGAISNVDTSKLGAYQGAFRAMDGVDANKINAIINLLRELGR